MLLSRMGMGIGEGAESHWPPLLLFPGKKGVCQTYTVKVGIFVNEFKRGEWVYKFINLSQF